MHIELITTGTELLLGNTLNTHALWIGRRLFEEGFRLQGQTSVPDGDAIRRVLEETFPRTEAILCTGGLGPTCDDITREIAARLYGLPLQVNAEVEAALRAYFASRGREPDADTLRQALVPEGCQVLPNPNGTAPGLYFPAQKGLPHLFLMPGPPREMRPMFQDHVLPILRQWRTEAPPHCVKFKCTGLGESEVVRRIEPMLKEIEGLEVGYRLGDGDLELRFFGPESATEEARRICRETLGTYLFDEGDRLLEEVLVDVLRKNGLIVSTAESCTGGMIADRITDVPGASEVFAGGVVVYSNELKQKLLGVPAATLEAHGAVSSETAQAMAEGCLAMSASDMAISVTGIAGPGGGTEEKPVGTAWLGLAVKGKPTVTRRIMYPGTRDRFKLLVSQTALDYLRREALGLELP
jgi:nicotinamide-nucleotide amidase